MTEGVSCAVLEAGSSQEPARVGLGCQSSLSLRERLGLGFLLHACRAEKDRLSVIDPVPGGVICWEVAGTSPSLSWYSLLSGGTGNGEALAFCRRVELGLEGEDWHV